MNKVILIGHLGSDPDVRIVKDDVKVAQFNIATSEFWTDRSTNEKKSSTEWHRVNAWYGLARLAENYMKKGSHVCVEGKIKTRSWEDKNNIKRYVTEIVADNITLLDKKGTGQSSPPHVADSPENVQGSRAENVQGSRAENATMSSNQQKEIDNEKTSLEKNDDLPF